jgi:predicted N-acetyltransferase YhbS
MTEPSFTILPETADDAVPIERLHERTFGPGRYAKSAYRLREGMGHQLELSARSPSSRRSASAASVMP